MSVVEAHTAAAVADRDPELEARVLEYLKLDPRRVETQALLAVCRRHQLDPLLRHVVLVEGRTYITRDGMLQVAHDSGVFGGIELDPIVEDDEGWSTFATVWRTDIPRPFRYPGHAPRKVKSDTPKQAERRLVDGWKMAVKDAELTALRRAFNIGGIDSEADAPLTERPATTGQLEAIQALAQALTDDQRAEASAWRAEAGIDWAQPTYDEAAAAIAYLREITGGVGSASPDRAGAGEGT